MEEWRQCDKFNNYEVSSEGRVRNKKTGRIIKTSINERGYEYVCLRDNGLQYTRRVHRLIADSFIEGDHDKLDVAHLDGDRSNNRVDNLIVKTRSENMQDSFRKGRRQTHRMKRIMCVETGEIFESITDCAKKMGTSREAVSRCVNNQALANKDGYHFKVI